ncbi:ABC transporter permease subunit [Paractinoplanes rhizophilus]|uniref:ABC transporter permease subunit n=1 Tax=Paractinoplanes rhizophilus TaxID=1416877 RepID=A0ABW2HP87_9ACTN
MSLYKAETRRLVKRRFTKLFVLCGLLVLAAVAAGVFLSNQRVGPETVARAKAEAQRNYQESVQETNRIVQECQAAQGTADAGNFPPNCEISAPQQSDFDPEWYMPATFDFRDKFPEMVTTFAAVLALVAYIVGASFVGAEWSSGGMMNLLLWRPRRLQVLGTKLLVLLTSAAALTAVLGVLWTVGFYLIAQARGSTESMTGGAWQSIGLMEVRGLVLVLLAGALGFGLASLGRHTAMALGVAIGVIVVLQFGLLTVLSLANVKFPELYLAPFWIFAWLNKEYVAQDYTSCDVSPLGGCQPETLTITWQLAGGAMAALFLLVVGGAIWTMRRRDIT